MPSSQIQSYLERCLLSGTHATERERASADFERRYLEALLYLHDGEVARAAAAAWTDRAYFCRDLRRYGIAP